MSGYLHAHTREWLEYFADHGYPGAEPLAAGAEGAVYLLGDGTVAKVWGNKREPELTRMQAFYADVARAGLAFATPEILRVAVVSGRAVTFERWLPGEPLQRRLSADDRHLDEAVVTSVIGVLRALRGVPATEAMKRLPVLDEDRPLWRDHEDFPAALTALLGRRVARFGGVLRPQVPDLDRRHARVAAGLAALDRVPVTVIHGDLFAENILAGDDGGARAVLDFGFLSTAGDPRLDAAITAAIMNMYGPHAPDITATLTRRFAVELGYPVETLLIYRAAYALATSNAFTDDGSDGHFAWCVAQLTCDDVTAALGL